MSHFGPKDDLIHEIGTTPYARESLFWVMPVPEHGIAGLAYLWRDGDTGKWGRFVGFGDSLARKPLFLDAADDLDLEGNDLDDCVVGGLHVSQPDPLETVELRFSQDGVELECSMTGLHPPFSWRENENGCPDWAADDRFEQSMRTRGRFTVDGHTTEFESMGHRDHSWGTRDWRALQHWKWMNAATLDGEVSLHAWIGFALGGITYNGYVNRGGEVSAITFLKADATLDDNFMHTEVEAAITTADGRETRLAATSVAGLPIPARHLQMNEIAGRATIDGADAISHIELGWPQTYIADYVGS